MNEMHNACDVITAARSYEIPPVKTRNNFQRGD